ncbi:MAG TPA: AAA family ATPase [Capsulimonadaceae bacterium]|jgi:hypothetical protein
MDDQAEELISSRFIADVEKQLHRRKHVLLYGNIHDQFLWRGTYVTVDDFISSYFRTLGFNIVGSYDPVDGFQFSDRISNPIERDTERRMPEMMEHRFHDVVHRLMATRNADISTQFAQVDNPQKQVGGTVPDPAATVSAGTSMPPRNIPGTQNQQGVVVTKTNARQKQRIPPEEAFASIRLAVSQPHIPVAMTIEQVDMMCRDSAAYDSCERPTVALLMKCLLDAAIVTEGPLRGFRNNIILKAADLKRVPEWLYRDNPYVALVQATKPNKEERRQYALSFVKPGPVSGGFYGGDQIGDAVNEMGVSQIHAVSDEFADLTEGMQAMDLEALRITSWKERIGIREHEVWRLVDFFKFGIRNDPWESLSPERVRSARDILTKRVIGQPSAVEAVVNMLTTARVGLTMSGTGGRSAKPRGVFFFVGPTGVGKTELAKAVTQLVFGDERAFARFDMSEYKEEHAAEKLSGAPPGFVGYQEGGQLTNRVLEQPHSILLFDEIEKANPKVLDKFLQILEDGRLTDGKGQTAYFNQTAIIFTSNIGASDLSDPQTGAVIRHGIMGRVRLDNADEFSYDAVSAHFRAEVDWYFTSRIGRAELLNRLGDNIVVFDLLRPEFVDAIARKFLSALASSSMEKYKFSLNFDDSVIEYTRAKMAEGENLLFGGRRIKTQLETIVERPFNRYLFENYTEPRTLAGRTLRIALSPIGEMEVTVV